MANVFVTLERVSNEAGGGRVPEWLSTHPDPGNRVTATQARLDTLSRSLNNTITNRDGFLQHIGGLVYGADPRQGFFEGNTFYHPGMRFQITFPQGWKTQNAPTAVVGASPKQDAIIQLGLAGKTSPREAASQFLSQQGIQAGDGSTRSINGNDAATSYFQAQTEQGNIAGIVSFISYGGQTFGLLGYAGAQQFGGYESAIKSAIGSFGQLKNQDALNVKPNHVELVRLPRAMTLNEFNQEYPSTIPITELAIINEMAHAADQIPQGRIVKRVTGGREVKEAQSGERAVGWTGARAHNRRTGAQAHRARERISSRALCALRPAPARLSPCARAPVRLCACPLLRQPQQQPLPTPRPLRLHLGEDRELLPLALLMEAGLGDQAADLDAEAAVLEDPGAGGRAGAGEGAGPDHPHPPADQAVGLEQLADGDERGLLGVERGGVGRPMAPPRPHTPPAGSPPGRPRPGTSDRSALSYYSGSRGGQGGGRAERRTGAQAQGRRGAGAQKRAAFVIPRSASNEGPAPPAPNPR